MQFAVLTDSCADVPLDYKEKYPIIYVAPLHVNYTNTSYLDGVDISAEEVTRRFAQEVPKTSLPSVQEIQEIIRQIKQDGYTKVLAVSISSGLSGTFNAMRIAASFFPTMEFQFVDTKNIAIGSGMLAILAAQLAEKGLSLGEAHKQVSAHVTHTKVFFCVPTLDYLRKGGRIGLVSSFVGTALGLRPVITCNEEGIYKTINKARGWVKAISTTVEEAVQFIGSHTPYNLAIVHSGAEKDAHFAQAQLKVSLPAAPGYTVCGSISPALTVHTGPGCIGIGVQRLLSF